VTPRLAVSALVILSLAPTAAVFADEALSPQRAWSLAAAALLTERNGELHDRLAGSHLTAKDVEEARRLLREWWASPTVPLSSSRSGGSRTLDTARNSRERESSSARSGLTSAEPLTPDGARMSISTR
jgi:hypothetical protein